MHRVHIDRVALGSRLGKAIFTPDGRILLSAGVELRESYLDRIKSFGIKEIFIEDDISRGIELQEAVREETRNEVKQFVKNMMMNYSFTSSFNTDQVRVLVDKIIDELLSSSNILLSLTDIKSVDDYTFEHSVNVCIISLIMGVGLGYSQQQLKDLGIGALLHDIGKLRIPESILKKPMQLTVEEFEEIKKHTAYGYEILKRNEHISPVSAYIAYGHHERYDGSGYPLQLAAENIQECARIVAVADVYDALTSDRVYRKKLRAHEVFEYITALGSHHFDQKVVDSFVKYVAVYPIGTGVMLNTRERGLVVRVNRHLPTRPVIRVVYDNQNRKLENFHEVDLAKRLNVFILDSCEI